jgi:hypothetical protein
MNPTNPEERIEAIVRDALNARADSVEPTGGLTAESGAAAAARARQRQVRNRALYGVAAAAAIVAGVLVAASLTGGSDGKQRVATLDSTTIPSDTTATTSGTEPTASTTVDGTVTVPATTPGTTVATTIVATTPSPPPTTTIAPATTLPPVIGVPGATLEPKSGAGAAGGLDQAVLTNVRTGRNGGIDRVVLEFAGNTLPSWSVGYEDGPFTQDGSGEGVDVSGSAFLHVRLDGATEVDPATSHAGYHGGSSVPGNGTTNVTECVNNGDFEAVVSWIIGLHAKTPFVVHTLSSPARIVIDIQDPSRR